VNGDGKVNFKDIFLVAKHLGDRAHGHKAKYDVNRNGWIGIGDLLITIGCAFHQRR
jgi:hypothetical protein